MPNSRGMIIRMPASSPCGAGLPVGSFITCKVRQCTVPTRGLLRQPHHSCMKRLGGCPKGKQRRLTHPDCSKSWFDPPLSFGYVSVFRMHLSCTWIKTWTDRLSCLSHKPLSLNLFRQHKKQSLRLTSNIPAIPALKRYHIVTTFPAKSAHIL